MRGVADEGVDGVVVAEEEAGDALGGAAVAADEEGGVGFDFGGWGLVGGVGGGHWERG